MFTNVYGGWLSLLSKRARIILVAVCLVVLIAITGGAAYAANTKTVIRPVTIPTAAQKRPDSAVAATQNTTETPHPDSQQVTQTPSPAASQPTAAQPAKTQASAVKSSATPSSPWVYKPSDYKPTSVPMVIESVNLNTGSVGCAYGNQYLQYGYDVRFNQWNSGGVLADNWEFRWASEVSNDAYIDPTNSPFYSTKTIRSNTVQMYDTLQLYSGFATSPYGAYQIRLHITAPSDIYSNWVTVPRYTGGC